MADDYTSGVEKLKDKLYSRKQSNASPDIRTPLEPRESSVPPAWKDSAPVSQPGEPPLMSAPPKRGLSVTAKFLLGSVAFFLLAAAVSALVFFFGGNVISPQNIDLQVVAPSLIDGGKEATFQIIATNRNQSNLVLVDMLIDYPDGARSAEDPTKALTHERQSIGTIASGQQIKRSISGIFYGEEGSTQTLKVTLEYNVAGSNAVFQKETDAQFTIGSSPVSVTLDAPSEAIAGDQFTMNINVHSNTTAPLNNVVLQGQYPFGFSVASANPPADAGGTLWRLGTLNPGATKTIALTGTIQGQDNDERVFRFIAGSDSDQTDTQIKVPYLTVPYTLTVHKPFVSASLSVNGQTGDTVSVQAGQPLSGTVRWQNNLSDAISNAQLVLTFEGPALDKNSVQAVGGFYQSTDSSITWSPSQDQTLANVAPGASGVYSFSFATLPPAAGNVLITNPTIKLNLKVQGTRAGGSGLADNIQSAAALTVQLASAATLTAQALHFAGPYTNGGPMPPKAETATTYSIVLTLKNSSNELANAAVTTVLPPYVQFLSAIPGENVTYDAASRTVTWPVGSLKAGVGYTSSARQAAFQVTLTPSSSQVGTAPALTGPVSLSAQDRFAQVSVSADAAAPTTQLTGDSGFTSGMGLVAPKQ